MVNVNKKYLDEEFKKSVWREFKKELENSKSENEFKKIIENWLAPSERVMIEKRLAIIYLLKQGATYRKIGEIIDVSPSTISYIKNRFNRKERIRRVSEIKIRNSKRRNKYPKYPTYKGRGRWGFLDLY